MLRRILVIGGCSLMLASGAVAGPDESADAMAAMMEEMSNCTVCKHMVAHMDVLGPVMTMNVVRLNDGMVMVHGVSDAELLDVYRTASAEMGKAGEACMAMSDDEAKSDLCTMCQTIRGAMVAGARMSKGDTMTGDMMVLTSDDPAVQEKLSEIANMCEMMVSSM